MTFRDAITDAAARISQQPDLRDHARRDAETLLLHLTGAARTVLFTEPECPVDEQTLSQYDALVDRRLTGEPIQYLVGEQEFYGLSLKVTPAVLIPRPETELLVEAVLVRLLSEKSKNRTLRIIDVGTGSGAIAIAIASHLPNAEITALDLSEAALTVARANGVRLGVADRITFIQSDLLHEVTDEASFDAILSNPPYISHLDRESLHRQVRDFEPETALFARNDGLEIYQRFIPQAAALLRPGGLLAMEMGFGQSEALQSLLNKWSDVRILDDLQGIARVILAQKVES